MVLHLLLTDVDGLYTANPSQDPTAKRLIESTILRRSRWLVVLAVAMELAACWPNSRQRPLRPSQGFLSIFARLSNRMLIEAAQEQMAATLAEDKGLKPEKQWLAFAQQRGWVWVDAGSAEALDHGKSLLISVHQGRRFLYHDRQFTFITSLWSALLRLGQSTARDLLQSKSYEDPPGWLISALLRLTYSLQNSRENVSEQHKNN